MKIVQAGEILKIKTGKYDANHAKIGGEFTFFTCADVPSKSDTYSFDDEVLILPGNGANVGNVYYFNGKLEAYQRTYVLHEIKAFPKYIYYYFSKFWIRQITKRQVGSATNYIKMDDIVSFEILLPELEIQKRIAKTLDDAVTLVNKTKKLLKEYDVLAQSIFLDMFGDPVTNIYNFPVGTIRDLVKEAKYGTSEKASDVGQYPYLRMNNLTYEGFMDYSNLKYVDISQKDLNKYLVQKGDLLFNRTNSKELVGKTAIFDSSEPMIAAGYLIRVRFNTKASPYFVSYYLNSQYGKLVLKNMCKSIVGMANINAQEMQDIKILMPPIDLQNQFAEKIALIEQQKELAKQELKESEDLFNCMLQKAFKRELSSTVT